MASTEVSPAWPAFPARLMALPAVNDAYDLAAHLYQRSKEYKVVGVALGMAEGSLKMAVTVAVPLTVPLVRYVEHLKPLDEWACRRLDDVARMVPLVTKPSGEVLSATREGFLSTLAGGDKAESSSSLSAAVCSRASILVEVIKEKTTVAAGRAPHLVLNAAYDLLDHYLPERRGDPEEPDVREGSVGVKTIDLATKTTRRLCHIAHNYLHAPCPLEPTPSHLAMECVQLVRYKCLGRPGEEVKHPVVVQVLAMSLKMSQAVFNHLLAVGMLVVRPVNAACMKMKSESKPTAPLTPDQKPHDN